MNKQFRTSKSQRGYTLAELIIVIGFFVTLAVMCGIGYVAFHFISKFW